MTRPENDNGAGAVVTKIIDNACRGCGATGTEYVTEEGVPVSCRRCRGTGDELGTLLLGAFELGRAEALGWLRYSLERAEKPVRDHAGAQTAGAARPMSESGFREYDLGKFRDWPEFRALCRALDDFARRAGDETEMGQADFERAVADLARVLPASDCCPACQRDGDYDAYAPFRATVDRAGSLQARYRCKAAHEWPCWWASREQLAEFST